jgi:hypothetical protein
MSRTSSHLRAQHPQAGILNRPPDYALFVALSLTTADAASTSAAVERLRTIVQEELTSDLADTTPSSSKDEPSAETGELGFTDGYDTT